MTKLSIIVPAYNSKKTITKTLSSINSILNDDIELIVVNDGSTDGTDKIIEQYIKASSKNTSYY